MEEKLAKIEKKRNMKRVCATRIPNRETKLLRRGSKIGSEGWVPKVAGRLGTMGQVDRGGVSRWVGNG